MEAPVTSQGPPGSPTPGGTATLEPAAPSAPAPPVRSRADLLGKRDVRSGWLCILLGVLIPLFALGGVFYGVRVLRVGKRGMGTALIVTGFTVFLTRLILYLG